MGIGNPVHLIFLAAIALIVLGPKRLPELARSLGHGMREFRESLNAAAAGEEHAGPEPVTHQPQLAVAATAVDSEPVGPGAQVEPVDPAQPVPSGDAPDSRPL